MHVSEKVRLLGFDTKDSGNAVGYGYAKSVLTPTKLSKEGKEVIWTSNVCLP